MAGLDDGETISRVRSANMLLRPDDEELLQLTGGSAVGDIEVAGRVEGAIGQDIPLI